MQLKEAGRAEALALFERIRVEDEVPSMFEDISICESSLDTADSSVERSIVANDSKSIEEISCTD